MARIAVSNAGPDSYVPSGQNVRFRARGGVVGVGETTVVGENGPEIAQFPAGTRIHPNGTGPASGGVINNNHFVINVGYGATPMDFEQAVIKAQAKYARRNGPGSLPQ